MPQPPPVDVKRWTPGRKAAVLAIVRSGGSPSRRLAAVTKFQEKSF
jgi:hypothetical protein